MGQRLDLQALLEQITGPLAVYFQPPANIQIQYPCIVYQRDYASTEFADNRPYLYEQRYQVTVIDRNPDSEIPKQVAMLPKTLFDRAFVAGNLNHDVFTMYF
jgi:hypothetical protein